MQKQTCWFALYIQLFKQFHTWRTDRWILASHNSHPILSQVAAEWQIQQNIYGPLSTIYHESSLVQCVRGKSITLHFDGGHGFHIRKIKSRYRVVKFQPKFLVPHYDCFDGSGPLTGLERNKFIEPFTESTGEKTEMVPTVHTGEYIRPYTVSCLNLVQTGGRDQKG